jgi:hypothetical protein
MASDMRDAVSELSWVPDVTVKLVDHFSAELINRGVAGRQDFRDVWPKIHADAGEDALAFLTLAGSSVEPEGFKEYLRKIAGARRNAAFNGFICRSLLAERKNTIAA